MTAHFQRGWILFQQGRSEDAIAEFQRHLLESPDDATTHAILSFCYGEREKLAEATEHAQQAIALAPESALGFRALATSLLRRNRIDEAITAIEEALRLEPDDADAWATLAHVHLAGRRWSDALAAADRGLTIEPEHGLCTNLRAQALVQLGDRAAAAKTMESALALHPDDSWTHANQGWSLLHANQPKEAMIHFREALRLEPDNDWARAGIVEAMQARNIVYRYLLRYFLWAGRLPRAWQWGLVVGGFLGNQFLNQLADQAPALRPFVYPLIGAYVTFAILTWLGPSFFNLLLRFDRFGRYALSRDQLWGANLLAMGLLPPLLLALLGAFTRDRFPFVAALFWVLMLLPASVIFRCQAGWPRNLMAAATGVMLLLNLLLTLPVIEYLGVNLKDGLWVLPLLGTILAMKSLVWVFLGLQFLGNYLAAVRVRS